MNFAAFSAVGSAGTHFVTTGGQLPVAKIQQTVANNGNLPQVCVTMGEGGVQYLRTLDGGATLQATPQLISVPISLPGTKPGDPQPTVQIQVLSPNHLIQTQQQPKYHMQIQGFQQGGAVLAVAYPPEGSEAGSIQLVGQSGLGEGLQVLAALPQEMQLVQPAQVHEKESVPPNIHQVFITPNQQIIINGPDGKTINNNTSSDNNNTDVTDIVIKEECDDNINDDENCQGAEAGEVIQWPIGSNQQDLVKYLNQLPPQQTQQLPPSLQQFLRINPIAVKKEAPMDTDGASDGKKDEESSENVLWEDGTVKIQTKKKKKYKKKPSKPTAPKPGQVVIATAMDGTPIWCCPECHMAYPDKEQLEAHLLGHNIERRFICGICGAGLKRKEHLERHKLGHNPERPYVCGVCHKGFKRREHLNLHTVIHSGVKTEKCNECGKGFYRKDHLRKHTRSHESKRAREEAHNEGGGSVQYNVTPAQPVAHNTSMMPEITIHIPSSVGNQPPVQINIPQQVASSLAAHGDAHTLDALLAQHS